MRGWRLKRAGRETGLLLAAALAACAAPDLPPSGGGPDPLTGVWSAELVLTRPLPGRPDPAHAGMARGHIALLREDRLREAPGLTGAPTHVGTRALALGGFGFEPRSRGDAPGVVARWVWPDSVELAWESPDAAETFTIRGHVSGDTITGRWRYGTRTAGAAGRVRMRRSR